MMSIIGQFLMESLIVMLSNTLVEVGITVDALAIYKLYHHFAQGTTWDRVRLCPFSIDVCRVQFRTNTCVKPVLCIPGN